MNGLRSFTLTSAAVALATIAAPLHAQLYRLVGEPDVASELRLHPDGRFDYFLSAGALDERASGRWERQKDTIRLTTDPKPRPPVFGVGAAQPVGGAPLSILVTWPDGRGIAGVDLIVAFDAGEPVQGYTQQDGWTLDTEEKRTPRSVTLSVPMHRLQSKPFAVGDSNRRLVFILTPNDMGVVDFDATEIQAVRDELRLVREGGSLTYRKVGR